MLAVGIALVLVGCGPRDTPAPHRALASSPAAALSPSPSPSPSPSATPSVASSPTVRPAPLTVRYVFPVAPASRARFGHSHHDYPATDIFAACGDVYRAATSGRIIGVERTDRWQPSTNTGETRGGLSVTLLGADGVRYYGSHLRSVDTTITAGQLVAAGQSLGRVGNTGSARGIACHVHFGISPPCGTTDWYNRRGLIYPWPYLESWRAGGQSSPAAAVASYRRTRGCPTGPLAYP